MNVEGVLLVVRYKGKNENVATFLDVYDVFASKFCHFWNLGMYFKVIQLFKAKMEALRDKSSPKVENDPFFAPSDHKFSRSRWKTVFQHPQRQNLAQTNAFGDILLDGIFPLKQGFLLFTFRLDQENPMEFQ